MKVVKSPKSGRKRKSCNCGECESWELMLWKTYEKAA